MVCNFPPETYTLKASVEVPQHLIKRKKQQGHNSGADSSASSVTRNAVGTGGPQAPRQHGDVPNHIATNIVEPYKANNVHDSRILALHRESKILSSIEAQSRSKISG